MSLGSIHGGTRGNIIPESVTISGTIRSLSEETRAHLQVEIERVAGLADALGGHCDVDVTRGYPVTVNDAGLVAMLAQVTGEMLGTDHLHELRPSMGAEDFSLLANAARGCLFRLGVTPPGEEPSRGHSPTFRIDEAALPVGAALLAGCALRRLSGAHA